MSETQDILPIVKLKKEKENSKKILTNEEVMDHTARLWKYLPIPLSEPEPAPEYRYHNIEFSGSHIIAARVRGKKHKHEGSNCDDWYEVASFDKITCIAVSDGAGSKKFSRIGARESCRAAIGYLVRALEQAFSEQKELKENIKLPLSDEKCIKAYTILAAVVQQAVEKAYEAVETAYYVRVIDPAYSAILNRGLELKDLSGTLLLTILIPIEEKTKEHVIISCQIGDGMIALFNTKGEFSASLKLMGKPDSGDFSGETEFLTSFRAKDMESLKHRTKITRGIADTILVMSDGVADDYFPNETEMRRLYFDLIVNGIIPSENPDVTMSSLTAQQMKLFKKIPDPLSYPWVNDQTVIVALQYTKRICESLHVSLEDLWNDPTILSLAKLELVENYNTTDPSERLKVWLDNYVERGSFDDRTLVIAKL